MKKLLLSVVVVFAFTGYVLGQNGWLVNFEDGTTGPLTLHVMGCGAWDTDPPHAVSETFSIVNNPDMSGLNNDMQVMKFTRRGVTDGGLPWGGFWANCDPNVDVTSAQYIHIMVWKPRISPLKFKLEGGESGTEEKFSVDEQTITNAWEEIIFDFSNHTGTYPIVTFMPDFEDPLTAETFEMYFDNILFNDNPNPSFGIVDPKAATFAVYPNPVQSTLYISNVKNASKVVISNILGQQVMMFENINTNKLTISADELVKGIYMVSVYNNTGNVTTKKFMKE